MKIVEPQVFLVGKTEVLRKGIQDYLNAIGASEWDTDTREGGQYLAEVYGRVCYKSFKPGLNPNVTKVREGNAEYLKNVIESRHGSVFEHVTLNFILHNVSRVLTHELVRHRIGVAISQESLRYVRLDELKALIPGCFDEEAKTKMQEVYEYLEGVQLWLAKHFDIENQGFGLKKILTSAFRRMAPIGLATTIGWSCNIRSLRFVIEQRTSRHAEEEIRIVFNKVYQIAKEQYPHMFFDAEEVVVDRPEAPTEVPEIIFKNSKI